MKFIEDIEKQKYEDFMKKAPRNHFMQSYNWGQFYGKNMGFKANYVGLVDDEEKLIAAALLLEKNLPFGFTYLYSPRGYIIDFNDTELLKLFTNELKKYAKKKKAIFINLNPDIDLKEYDEECLPKESGNNNFALVNTLKKLGYKYIKNKNIAAIQPKYTFRLNIEDNIDNIFNNFHTTAKRWLKKDIMEVLTLYKNDDASIDDFYLTMLETSKREGINQHDFLYYQSLYSDFKEDDMSSLYVVKVHVSKLKEYYKKKITDLKTRLDLLLKKPEKNKNIIKDIELQISKLETEEEQLKDIKDDEIALSGILTVNYEKRTWFVYIGNNSLLRELGANYFICYEIIKDMKNNGYKQVDFVGTTGDLREDNPVYGIHRFKKSFGGIYHEFIGDFDYPVNKLFWFIFKKLIPLYRNIKKKLAVKKIKTEKL